MPVRIVNSLTMKKKQKSTIGKNIPPDLVFEIGIEELPSPYFDDIYSQKDSVAEYFFSCGLLFSKLDIHVTLRRIVFHLHSLQAKQSRKEELIKGPAFEKSFDSNGKTTRALEGFLKSKGATICDIIEIKDGKRHCAGIKKTSGGGPVENVLPDIFSGVLRNFSFPRNMGWNDSGVRFPRPIRWLFCLYAS